MLEGFAKDILNDEGFSHFYTLAKALCDQHLTQQKISLLLNSDGYLNESEISSLPEISNYLAAGKDSTASMKQKAIAAIFRAAIYLKTLPESLQLKLNKAIINKDFSISLEDNEVNDKVAIAFTQILPCTYLQHLDFRNITTAFLTILKKHHSIISISIEMCFGLFDDTIISAQQREMILNVNRNFKTYHLNIALERIHKNASTPSDISFNGDDVNLFNLQNIINTSLKIRDELDSLSKEDQPISIEIFKKNLDCCVALMQKIQFEKFEELYSAYSASESKLNAFIDALKALLSPDNSYLIRQFQNQDHQKLFDTWLLSAIGMNIKLNANGVEILTPENRRRYLLICLTRWNPTNNNDVALKKALKSHLISSKSLHSLFSSDTFSNPLFFKEEDTNTFKR